jgi:hypothetical protein
MIDLTLQPSYKPSFTKQAPTACRTEARGLEDDSNDKTHTAQVLPWREGGLVLDLRRWASGSIGITSRLQISFIF